MSRRRARCPRACRATSLAAECSAGCAAARPAEPARSPERGAAPLAEQEALRDRGRGAEPASTAPRTSRAAAAARAAALPAEGPAPRARRAHHAEAKVDRALELFNGSGHQRTIAGLARTLGPGWVSAQPDPAQPSAVSLLVAWELSWYRYRVDLGDEADPVEMLDKGEELDQIDGSLREWNAALDADGRVVAGRGARPAGEGRRPRGRRGARATRARRRWPPWPPRPTATTLGERNEYIGEATNNVAEYRALLLGLELARELGASEVEVVNDSELVARQIGGEYKVKHAGLKPLYLEAMGELRGFDALGGAARCAASTTSGPTSS